MINKVLGLLSKINKNEPVESHFTLTVQKKMNLVIFSYFHILCLVLTKTATYLFLRSNIMHTKIVEIFNLILNSLNISNTINKNKANTFCFG